MTKQDTSNASLSLPKKQGEQRQTAATMLNIQRFIYRIPFWILVIAIALYTMLPFIYAISISFRTNSQVLVRARYLPEAPTLTNFQNLFSDDAFMKSMANSAIVATVTVLLALVVGSFAAYALGRVQFKGRMLILYLVLAMTMFPQISVLSGLFNMVNDLGIYGSTASLIFAYPIFTLPFTVWVLTSFFQGLPGEIEQAALVDGATPFQTFWRILVPLTAPALVTTGLLAFISAWNEYLFALTFTLVSPKSQTVPVVIANFAGYSYEVPIADRIAATVVVTVPVLVLVLIFQRRIIEGLTAGAVKG
jgi:trehalose/maltose transport system permease protein